MLFSFRNRVLLHPGRRITGTLAFCSLLAICCTPMASWSQEAVDEANAADDVQETSRLSVREVSQLVALADRLFETIQVRVRVTKTSPTAERLLVDWREGGEGLGGNARTGTFLPTGFNPAEDPKKNPGTTALAANQWSTPLTLKTLIGTARNIQFPTITARRITGTRLGRPLSAPQEQTTFEFEFSTAAGRAFKNITEDAPQGATVSLAIPGVSLAAPGLSLVQGLQRQYDLKNPKQAVVPFDPVAYPEFVGELQGLSGYVHERHERLQKKFSLNDPLPKQIGVMAKLGGYGVIGYGVRYSNRAIAEEEAENLHLMGINGMRGIVGPYEKMDELDLHGQFDRIFIGPPGAGTPMAFFKNAGSTEIPSPFSPKLREAMEKQVETAIAAHAKIPVKERWALWGDEINVAIKEDIDKSPSCTEEFRKYLQANGVQPPEVGAAAWAQVQPYAIWKKDEKGRVRPAPVPASAAERRCYYYTFRFLTYATGQLYAPAAAKFEAAGIKLYAMQAPTPSWGGSSLDWHEFYDQKPNRLLVFETSNRDERVWQWESYLADIMRGIGQRHGWPLGALIKPHRGAPEQRMLALLARGMRGFEWYTYGPDYVKGDNFSRRPDYVDAVAKANRFAAKTEEFVFEAQWLKKPEAAFVFPRSTAIWQSLTKEGFSFEDAKWVYLALRHAHIPVDILSEQQLIEGKHKEYKMLYIVGTNLHHDAAAKVREWVQGGGVLWTDLGGLARDEANEPAPLMNDLLGLGERRSESWGSIPSYGSTGLSEIKETTVPAFSAIKLAQGASNSPTSGFTRAAAAREALDVKDAQGSETLARFADGRTAAIRHRFGKGMAYTVGLYAGASYSAKVRRPDFDMTTDYDPALRELIVGPALAQNISRPVLPAAATVEALPLVKDGRRSIALVNWTYKPGKQSVRLENLRITLADLGELRSVRSLQCGPLQVEGMGKERYVVLPHMDEVDLLVME